MKILWVSNSPIGPAAKILNTQYQGASGGWIQSEYEALAKDGSEMYFLCSDRSVAKNEIKHLRREEGEAYCVHAPRIANGLPNPRYLVECISRIIDEIKPDIIHIWGTETCVSNIVASLASGIPKVVYIQGLLGIHTRYLGGYYKKNCTNAMDFKGVFFLARMREWVRARLFIRQAEKERETLTQCGNAIVDSDFSRSYCRSLDKNIVCYGRVLLPNREFTKHRWNIENAYRNTIFTVYGGNSEKGLQQLLKAVAIIKQRFPNILMRIPGCYRLDNDNKLVASKIDSFSVVFRNLMHRLDLENNVEFLGWLSVREMAEAICKSHVFVNPSCMEVHALSLREALTEGVPCISAMCGSVNEFIKHGESGFVYRYEEYEVLAYYIEKLFLDDSLAQAISNRALHALDTFGKNNNLGLMEIYKNMRLNK